jgi:hypothetical protein
MPLYWQMLFAALFSNANENCYFGHVFLFSPTNSADGLRARLVDLLNQLVSYYQSKRVPALESFYRSLLLWIDAVVDAAALRRPPSHLAPHPRLLLLVLLFVAIDILFFSADIGWQADSDASERMGCASPHHRHHGSVSDEVFRAVDRPGASRWRRGLPRAVSVVDDLWHGNEQ